jgi:hypothetical protein
MTFQSHDQIAGLYQGHNEAADLLASVDRRAFLMRSAMVNTIAVLNGCSPIANKDQVAASTPATPAATAAPPLSPDLDVVKKAKVPVMTVLSEFYKVGPGPSSSHTIGPMRIIYDVDQRCLKLPAEQLARATALRVHLFGSLSSTGKGHGTERAALAGIVGKEPATVEPAFLDSLAENPDQTFQVKHHLGMTCDPVAGFVQVPCIERCAFGAVKSWTGFMIASNEIPTNRRVDFDTTVEAMALTAKELNAKYKETSEGGLAVSVVLC